MKNNNIHFYILILITVLFSFTTCNDPIFNMIARETKIEEPLIKGSPTNFVLFTEIDEEDENIKTEKMFVASGRNLWSYNDGNWSSEKLDMHIIQIAATDNFLYVLCYKDTDKAVVRELRRRGASEKNWTTLEFDTGGFNNLHSIYSAGQLVYIGSQGSQKDNADKFAIISINDTGTSVKVTDDGDALLIGAAYNGIPFLLTRTGILVDGTMRTMDNPNFMGIIALPDNTVVAINRNGNLYEVSSTGINTEALATFNDNRRTTGAMAIWEDKDDPSKQLLLVGRGDTSYSTISGYTHGYVELLIDETGNIGSNIYREPGPYDKDIDKTNFPTTIHTTVDDRKQYYSSLGTNPVNFIFQIPETVAPEKILFAATQRNGVWSFRDRDGVPQWNTETKNNK